MYICHFSFFTDEKLIGYLLNYFLSYPIIIIYTGKTSYWHLLESYYWHLIGLRVMLMSPIWRRWRGHITNDMLSMDRQM